MITAEDRYTKIIKDPKRLAQDLDEMYYANSNEKQVLREKLTAILNNQHHQHALDLGSGPGLVSTVLEQHATQMSLVDINPEYEALLLKKFPQANVTIQSLFDLELNKQYDLILLSHVLYYISEAEWKKIISRLYSWCREMQRAQNLEVRLMILTSR